MIRLLLVITIIIINTTALAFIDWPTSAKLVESAMCGYITMDLINMFLKQ